MRNTYIDNIKGIMIFFVVLGHIISSIVLHNEGHSHIYDAVVLWIYYFHMPVFFFISGYLSKNVSHCRENAFTNTYIPFFLVNVMLCIIYHMKVNPFIYPAGAAWFLLTLFFYRIMLKDLIRIKKILILSIVLAMLVTYLGKNPTFGNFCIFLPFFICGVNLPEIQIYAKGNKVYKKIACVLLVLSFIIVLAMLKKFDITFYSPFYLSYAEIGFSAFYKQLLVYFIAMLFIILWLYAVDEKQHFYTNWGKYSITIYVFHAMILPYMKYIPKNFNGKFMGAVTVVISIAICIVFGNRYIEKLYKGAINIVTKAIIGG